MDAEPVVFPAEGAAAALRVTGGLRVGRGSRGAVVVVDAAGASEVRAANYARALTQAGLTSLAIEARPSRGFERPLGVADGFAEVFGAFRYLTTRPEVDALSIGVLGFAFGGALSMLTATRAVARRYLRNGERFAAHAALHPVCWRYNHVEGFEFRDLTGAPILMQCGAEDDYDSPGALDALLASLDGFDRESVRPVVHPGARHGFDRLDRPEETIADPLAHAGQGGAVRLGPHPEAAEAALAATVAFFHETLTRA